MSKPTARRPYFNAPKPFLRTERNRTTLEPVLKKKRSGPQIATVTHCVLARLVDRIDYDASQQRVSISFRSDTRQRDLSLQRRQEMH